MLSLKLVPGRLDLGLGLGLGLGLEHGMPRMPGMLGYSKLK